MAQKWNNPFQSTFYGENFVEVKYLNMNTGEIPQFTKMAKNIKKLMKSPKSCIIL